MRRSPGFCPEGWRRSCGRRADASARPSGCEVTVVMSDIRSYSTIAEHADPSQLAGQLNTHRAAMNRAILGEGGTVMQFVGDAVMAVFGAPVSQADHADRAVAAAVAMHAGQAEINAALERGGAAPLRSRARAFDGRGRRRPARFGGAPRVHPRRRHREPLPAPPAAGLGGRDRTFRGYVARAHLRGRPPSRSKSSS